MTEGSHHHDHRGDEVTLTSDAALLRAAADGEVTAADQRRLDGLLDAHPHLQSSLEFERALRDATGRVMGAVSTPAGLADRVRAAIRADAEVADSIDALGEQTRKPAFWARRTWMSVAAVFVLGLSAALIIQATQISQVSLSADQLAYRQQLAGFLSTQHDKTCQDLVEAQKGGKLKFSDPTEYEAEIAKVLNHAVKVPRCDRSRKVYFAGGGRCGVPGEGPSGHMVYNAEFAPNISVFIKLDRGELPLKEGRTYALATEDCGMPGTRILTRSVDGVLYFFVFREGSGCQKALAALGVDAPSARY